MKILQINGVIHQGSTGEIVDAINDYLDEKGIKSIEHVMELEKNFQMVINFVIDLNRHYIEDVL